MYKLIFFLVFSVCIYKAYSQPLPDSTKAQYSAATNDNGKGKCLMDYFRQQPLNDTIAKTNVLLLKAGLKNKKMLPVKTGATYALRRF